MTLIADVFPKLPITKTLLDKCLKSPISEDPSKSSMVNGPKHCSDLNHRTFSIFIHYSERNCVGISFSE